MKNFRLVLVLATIVMTAVSCGPKKTQKIKEKIPYKMLVVYYSQTSNTKAVATEIATRLNADLEEIVPLEPYENDFQRVSVPRFSLLRSMWPTTTSSLWVIPSGSAPMRCLCGPSWIR